MESPRKRWWRGWWWKVPVAFFVLAVFAPTLASPLVRRVVTDKLERELGGEVDIESFSLSWPANLEVSGVRVRDSQDRPTLSLSTLEASVDAGALLSGGVAVDARGNGVEVHLRQQADGSWQVGEPPDEEEDEDEGSEETEDDSDGDAGTAFSGDLWLGETTVVLHALDGEVRLEGLELGASLPADPSELTTFHLAFDAVGEGGPAGTLRSDGKLVLGALDRVDPRDIEAQLEIEGLTLAALRPVLAVWLPERIPSGTLDTSLTLSGETERLRLRGSSAVTDLEVQVLVQDNDPLVLRDPRVQLDVDAEVVPDTLDVVLSSLSLDSRMARCNAAGRITGLKAWQDGEGDVVFDGLQGSLAFVPDRLTELFGPDLPIQLAGDTERTIAFDLQGRAADMSLEAFLAGCAANAKIELGEFATTGIQGSGDLELRVQDRHASWVGKLLANGGGLDLAGEIGLGALGQGGDDGMARLQLAAKDLGTNAELAPLLSLLHPAFAAAEVLENSHVSGRITCDLDLAYEGPLGSEVLSGGWETFPKVGIRGSGRFTITEARLDGTPALGEMLAYLGVDTTRSVDIRPIEFAIDEGRLTYQRPWTWTIDDIETTFTGSVGLDQTLALSWNVPVTEELIEEHRFLRHIKGKLIQLPITGTVKKPKLEWQDALAQFATEGVRDELLDKIGIGAGGGDDDPDQLLEEANKLWDEGKKVEAAVIYKRIREDFKLSITYALNRDRIKKRGKYQE